MKKVLVGISGGVDSSVAAFLLKKDGYEVIGATMLLNDCDSELIAKAKDVCDNLNIKHYVFDFKNEFKEKVINNFILSYQNGETPNPCVLCNKYFKFGLLYEKALELGCDFIATGHYVKSDNGMIKLCNNKEKDQTYFLNQINKEVIDHTIFPLNKFNSKDEIRKIAKDNNLITYNSKDSQEICFIPNDDYHAFLKNKVTFNNKNNNFILKDGTILGKHNGIYNYTIGQRKGLNISYKHPLYVIDINKETNEITLGEESDLYNDKLICNNVNLFRDFPEEVLVKIRYKSIPAKANIKKIDNDTLEVTFFEKQRAITKGQSIVFYDNDILLGGAIIKEIIN